VRHVTLRQLRTFTEVMRAGSYSAAAQALHLTPPAVTVQMRQLEASAGMPLVERTEEGIVATAAGRELMNAAARIDSTIVECAEALSALKGLKGGHVSIGVVSTAKYFAPQALAGFLQRHPSVEVRLEVGNRATIIAALEANTLDLAMTGWPPGQLAVEKEPVGDHPHIIIARPDHPLASRRRVPPSALKEETFLVREPGSGTRLLMERLFAESRVQPRLGMEMGSNETIKQAVIAGLGIAFLSAHTVAAEVSEGRLIVLDIVGLPVMRRWFVVHLTRKRLLPAAMALRDYLIGEGHSFLPPLSTPPPARTRSPRRKK
jgi:LysR family transcriptional regulator, low CO2-responsive transcriptional regulator